MGWLRRRLQHIGKTSEVLATNIRVQEPQTCTYAAAIYKLNELLKVEEYAKHYLPQIRFYSNEGVTAALNLQFNFLQGQFFLLINGISEPGFFMSTTFLGAIFGNLRTKFYEDIVMRPVNNGEIEIYSAE